MIRLGYKTTYDSRGLLQSFPLFQQSNKLLVRRIASQPNFKVRRLTTPEEVRDKIFSRAADEGWRPGALDHVGFFAAENHFFVGELDGKPISSVFFLKHGNNFMQAGGLIVDKQHRGKGYAMHTFKSTFGSKEKSVNVCGDSTSEMLSFYAMFGFKPQWYLQCFDIKAYEVPLAEKYRTNILTPSKKLFPAIINYDTHVHVYPRPLFLEKWVFAPNSHCSVAVNSSGGVVGYGVVRTTLGEDNGWRVGPLFADNSTIARDLYQDLFVKAAASCPEANITMNVSHGKNFSPDSLPLVTELGGTPMFQIQMVRIYTRGIPPGMPLHKVFVMT